MATEQTISGDVLNRIKADLDSIGMSTDFSVDDGTASVTVRRGNATHVSHTEVSYDRSGACPQGSLHASSGTRRVLISSHFLDDSTVRGVLAPSENEEIVGGKVTKRFCEPILSRAQKYLGFTGFASLHLTYIWVVRKQLAYYDEGGKPVFKGEEPACERWDRW